MAQQAGGNILLNINTILEVSGVQAAQKVADLGCGASGHVLFPLANAVGKNGKIYAVDILKNVLEGVRRKAKSENYQNIETIWSNLEVFGATKIESGSLDLAFLVNTLYQSKKRAEIIRESVRMLKKGGYLLIVEWKNIASPFGPLPEDRVDPNSLKIGAKKLGLHLEKEFEAGQYHYGMLYTKM